MYFNCILYYFLNRKHVILCIYLRLPIKSLYILFQTFDDTVVLFSLLEYAIDFKSSNNFFHFRDEKIGIFAIFS